MVNGGFATCKFAICTVSPLRHFRGKKFCYLVPTRVRYLCSLPVFSALISMKVV